MNTEIELVVGLLQHYALHFSTDFTIFFYNLVYFHEAFLFFFRTIPLTKSPD